MRGIGVICGGVQVAIVCCGSFCVIPFGSGFGVLFLGLRSGKTSLCHFE